jgi:hypothetical protein
MITNILSEIQYLDKKNWHAAPNVLTEAACSSAVARLVSLPPQKFVRSSCLNPKWVYEVKKHEVADA